MVRVINNIFRLVVINKLAFFLLLLIFQTPLNLVLAETLRWGYLNFPPFTYRDKHQDVQGSLADIVKNVTSKANISVRSLQYPNRRAYKMIEDGNINFGVMIKSQVVNNESHLISRFPVSKYMLNTYSIGNKKPITQLEQLQGSSVILIAGYRYGNGREYIENKHNNITIASNVENHTRAFESLVRGRADYMLGYAGPAKAALISLTIDNLQSSLVREIEVFFVLTKETKDAENIMRRLEQSYIDIYGLPK
jgi:polar amino acid transport system substrate-binding protein